MIPWFRFYSEVLRDRKVQMMPTATKWRWVMLLCLANEGRPRGVLPPTPAMAFELKIPRPDVEALIRVLIDRGLLDRDDQGLLRPHKWAERQFSSDASAERMRRFRERKRDVTVTDPDNREQITDSDSSRSARRFSPRPSPRTGQKTSPLTVVSPPINADVAALVDLFRAIPNVVASSSDGGTIASLVGRHGAGRVRRVIQDKTPAISAADSPRLFLASCFDSARGKATAGMTMDEKAQHYQSLLKEEDPQP